MPAARRGGRFAPAVRVAVVLACVCNALGAVHVSAVGGTVPQVRASDDPELCVVWTLPDGTDYSHCMAAPRQLHGLPLVDEYGMPVGQHAVHVELRGAGEVESAAEPVAAMQPLRFDVTPPVVAPTPSDSDPVPAPGTDPAAYTYVASLHISGGASLTATLPAHLPPQEFASRVCGEINGDAACVERLTAHARKLRTPSAYFTTPPPPPPLGAPVPPTPRSYWDEVASLERHLESYGLGVLEGHTAMYPSTIDFYHTVMARFPGTPRLVCEIGFNAGHSALVWLTARPDAHTRVLAFDLGTHHYAQVSADYLNDRFEGRVELVLGDSMRTVPLFTSQHPDHRPCDIIIVDGGHTHEQARADLANMRALAGLDGPSGPRPHVLVVDDAGAGCHASWCLGPQEAWREAIDAGLVQPAPAHSVPNGLHIVTGRYTVRPAWADTVADAAEHRLALVTVVVREYDEAIDFYSSRLGFVVEEDTLLEGEGGKRWVVMAPSGTPWYASRVLLARASTPEQLARVGTQTGGRVGMFLYTDNLQRDVALFTRRGVEFVRAPKRESYGSVAVFKDLYGNLWDLLEPSVRA